MEAYGQQIAEEETMPHAVLARRGLEGTSFDVRVKELMTHDVALRDILGSELVTFDHHVDIDPMQPLQPKAVYVQYQALDPVSRQPTNVIVPANMSLDVYVDPNLFGYSMEVEEEVEEEQEQGEEEDRRKLRSSIRGDPILSRAQPAPPPDPYFAPLRHETLNAPAFHGGPHAKGTMSSFLKASGKDKYCRSRLDEIDKMLKQTVEKARKEGGEDEKGEEEMSPTAGGSPMSARAKKSPKGKGQGSSLLSSSLGSRQQRSKVEIEALAAEMVTHIQNMPVFDAGNKVNKRSGRKKESTDETAEDCAGEIGEENGASSDSPKVLKSPVAPSSPRKPPKVGMSPLAKKGQAILRDLDPHIDVKSSSAAPTQRLHSNWPFEPRRQLARHFYGMSPARILEEEEKERTAHTEKNDKPAGAEAEDDENYPEEGRDDSPEASQAQAGRKPRRQHLVRGLNTYTQDAEGGAVAHRLEIRIRNTEKTQRVVVGQRTAGPAQAGVRQCQMLDENQAHPRVLSRKF
eukprot:gnl/MRDRNA2_/MRDRNA2_97658_c0_seq1.p1 gnl/MRDRNA2_/MRDRNA2_97658_c0~~gnl/MRDRNA2_/MRDRNA2_97658_c0_seq1.p1  ORF type:complete len:516 (-),score=131.08 gnl/MRDRNA2_/MRDRNA2_97658_c0_seq1:117-1664(-)